ncbi:hypothetical protein HY933_01005 [Candidatus Falkowbacteria bacterium]|nr:hypothetical protein [Candidatus Falkowbacteria bacterium]
MSKKFLAVGALFVLFIFILGGCGQRLAGEIAERQIENEIGGDADVDFGNNTWSANVNGTAVQVGENVSLPDNFPADVYRIDGTVTSAFSNSGDQAYVVMIQTMMSASDAAQAYQRELAAAGWAMTGSANYGGTFTVVAQKDGRTLSVTAVDSGNGNAIVTLGESK